MIPAVSLSEICEITMGQAPVGNSYNESGEGYALIAGAGDFGKTTPEPKKFTVKPTRISQPDDLILCIRATIGDLNWSDKEYCPDRGVAGLRPISGKLDKNYLRHFIDSNKEQLKARGTGSTFKQVSRSHIEEWEIPLPPLKEQKRIAAILDKADAIRRKRRKRQQAIDLTDQLLRSVFLEMFGDPVTNPKGWGMQLFGNIVDNCDSMRVPLKQADRDLRHGEYPYYGSVGIIDYMDDYIFDGEYLLVSEDGKHLESRTRPIACIANGQFWVNNHAHVVKFNDTADLMYLAYYLEMIPIRKYITGIDQIELNRKSLDRIPVPVPPIELQFKFREFANKINNQKIKMDGTVSYIENLFSGLSQQAFNGQLSKQTKAA